jgi:hypothetical protein
VRAIYFGLVSVVIIAFAKSSPADAEADNFSTAFLIPLAIFFIGSCLPIMPVDATSTLCGLVSICLAVSAHIFIALLIPTRPVQAFALPELTTTAEISALFMCFLLTITAADTILLVVKAAAAFASLGQTSIAKSVLPDFLIPQYSPAAKNPFGDVIVLFATLNLREL